VTEGRIPRQGKVQNWSQLVANGRTPRHQEMRAIVLDLFEMALEAVDPGACVGRHITRAEDALRIGDRQFSLGEIQRIVIVGGGKASAAMAAKVVEILPEVRMVGAISVPNSLENLPTLPSAIQVFPSAHPVPDENSQAAALAILDLVENATSQDLVIALFSGGASALLVAPAPPVTLGDLQEMNRVLLRCGASIQEFNTVRKHVSIFKGGNVARRCAHAPLASLVISDVIGNPLDVIASGPTVPDESTFGDCLEIVEKYEIADRLPVSVRERLAAGARGEIPETPKAGDSCFDTTTTLLAGSVADAACTIKTYAQDAGWPCQYVTSQFQGEARDQGARFWSTFSLAGLHTGCNIFLHSGELTVTIAGRGTGGRNQEMLLAAASKVPPVPPVVVLSAGMDGIEGNSPAAGAMIDNGTIARAKKARLSPQEFLDQNDSYHFFEFIGDAVVTGLTGTNVNDLTITIAWGNSTDD